MQSNGGSPRTPSMRFGKVIMRKKISEIKHRDTIIYLFVFGCILDLFFRYLHIMPSLNGMYEKLSIPISMFFAGGPIASAFIISILTDSFHDRSKIDLG